MHYLVGVVSFNLVCTRPLSKWPAMSASAQALLLKRLREVLRQWPPDPSRKGRDFGEFLAMTYRARFEEESVSNVCHTKIYVVLLLKLVYTSVFFSTGSEGQRSSREP